MFLKPNQVLNNELLQEVAGYGSETVDRDDCSGVELKVVTVT